MNRKSRNNCITAQIMGRHKKVMFLGGKTAVTGVGKNIDRIFRMSGLYQIVEKYVTPQEAVENL